VRRLVFTVLSLLLVLTIAGAVPQLAAQGPDDENAAPDTVSNPDDKLLLQARALFDSIPAAMPGSEDDTPEMIALGEDLYFETALSINRNQSCNSCHLIDKNRGGSVYTVTAEGSGGEFGDRNAPTVLNAGFQVAQFWDGRAPNLEDQAKGPPLNPIEMGLPDEAFAVQRLIEAGYEPAFALAFPDATEPVTFENMAEAIAAFERTFITHDRFDEYLRGDPSALTEQEQQGLQTFIDLGCVQCHNGPLLGGVTYQKVGLFHPYPYTEDPGRFNVTENPRDMAVFKVPMLRNVALNAPYFHDGQVGTLGEAVDLMAYMQVDRQLTGNEIQSLLQFLNSLSDMERTKGNPPQIEMEDAWQPPNAADIPEGEQGSLIRYGLEIVTNTASTIGPLATDPALRFSGNELACANCHQQSGTKQYGLTWVGVMNRYPSFRARSGTIGNIEDRINGCMQRSLAGQPLPVDSREMQAIVAYFDFLSEGVPTDIAGVKMPPLEPLPERAVDFEAGEMYYNIYCRSCHGAEGEGYESLAARSTPTDIAVPPLWGEGSYNNGAGMNRVLTAASFIWTNMPLGTQANHPAITAEQAYDIAGYFNSFPRPEKPNLEADYPNRMLKPVDAPYPPYADDFPQEQHQFGPFQPIMEWYAAHPLPASVTVDDQALVNDTITVDRIKTDRPGWLVIYAADLEQDKPGAVIGYVAVPVGETANLVVPIDPRAATPVVFAMLHEDTGTAGQFDFPDADLPVDLDGAQVVQAFRLLE